MCRALKAISEIDYIPGDALERETHVVFLCSLKHQRCSKCVSFPWRFDNITISSPPKTLDINLGLGYEMLWLI